MSSLERRVSKMIDSVSQGRTLEALERYYAEDVVIFENHEMARAGLQRCLAYEKEQLSGLAEPPSFQARSFAVNDRTGTVFIEWLLRFRPKDGSMLRLEQVAVQKWSGDRVIEERFYYQGLIDESELYTLETPGA